MHSSRDYIDKFSKVLKDESKSAKIMVFYGEEGIGKSTLKYAIKEKFAKEITSCEYDVMSEEIVSFSEILDELYNLCNILEKDKFSKIYEFDIADKVYCSKVARIARKDRKSSGIMTLGSDIEGIISSVVGIPYLGSCIKTIDILHSGYKKVKYNAGEGKKIENKYSSLEIKELEKSLPKALSKDIARSIDKNEVKNKRVIFIDNFENIYGNENDVIIRSKKGEWIYNIIKNSGNIIWVIFSESPVKFDEKNPDVKIYEQRIERLNKEETENYLIRKKLTDKIQIPTEKLYNLSSGIPYKINLIIKYCEENTGVNEEDLKKITADNFLNTMINTLDKEEKELLYFIACTDKIDKELVRKIFPSYPYEIYRNKFIDYFFKEFNYINHTYYAVNPIIKEVILHIIGEKQKAAFNKTLFEYYYGALKQILNIDLNLGVPYTLDYCFDNFKIYGNNLKDKNIYVNCLLKLGSNLIYNNMSKNLLDECDNILSNYNGIIQKDNIVGLLKLKAKIGLLIGSLDEVIDAFNKGSEITNSKSMDYAELLCCKMKAQSFYLNNKDEKKNIINTAEEYLKCIKECSLAVSNKNILEKICEIRLFLGKQYVLDGRYEEGRLQYDEVLKICSSTINFIPSMYKYKAVVLERIGEVYAYGKKTEEAHEMYRQALKFYDMAQYIISTYDYDFILNNGLAWKRLSESFFMMDDIDNALESIDNAILKYEKVENAEPDIIDTYCKEGYAYIDTADTLLKLNINDESIKNKIKEYILKGIEVGNKGMEKNKSRIGEDENINRQIIDILDRGQKLFENFID